MAFSHKHLYLIPLDARPVCYDLPRRLAETARLELTMPAPSILGHLKKPANLKALQRWVKNHLFENDPVIVALDTVAYGGLIASRVNEEPLDVLQERVNQFFKQVKASSLFAFSSILRIPAYNNDEEEPAYWAKFGKALYDYSAELHEKGSALNEHIPESILEDFLARREKNHALNLSHIKRLASEEVDYLTFCQDDTGPYGLNVQEAQALAGEVKKRKLSELAHIQTGADEVASCMLARWMALQQDKPVKIFPFYSSAQGRKLIARFDGLPIETVVEKAIAACGATLAKKSAEADLWLMVHTPDEKQGDHCAKAEAKLHPEQSDEVLDLFRKAREATKPLMIADVAYANGGDPRLVERLVTGFGQLNDLYGYAGWNTPGNTIGTTVAMGIVRLLAERNDSFNAEAFNKLLLIRLADDWLYQADVRKTLRGLNGTFNPKKPDASVLNLYMADGLSLLKTRLNLEGTPVHCNFPCERLFEVEIAVS